MSNSQQRIISRLLAEASHSKKTTRYKVAAAICSGTKILSMQNNCHRNKYGQEIKCTGHSEIAAIYNLFPFAFRRKKKGSYVLQC